MRSKRLHVVGLRRSPPPPEDPERRVAIEAVSGELQLLDGRNLAQNGWFIVRSLLATKTAGKVAEWVVRPNVVPNWTRTPVIGFSQVGCHPAQKKVAVIELGQHDSALPTASLFEVTADGAPVERMKAKVQAWGARLVTRSVTQSVIRGPVETLGIRLSCR